MACCTAVVSNAPVARRTNGSKICMECDQTVYPLELVSAGQFTYHKWCFKCAQCNRTLSTSNYAVAPSGIPYCKPHYAAARNLKGGFEAFAVSYVTSSTSIQDLSNQAGQQTESTIVRWSTTPHLPQPVNRMQATEAETYGSSGSINSISSGSGVGSDNEDDGPSSRSHCCNNVSRVKAIFEMHK